MLENNNNKKNYETNPPKPCLISNIPKNASAHHVISLLLGRLDEEFTNKATSRWSVKSEICRNFSSFLGFFFSSLLKLAEKAFVDYRVEDFRIFWKRRKKKGKRCELNSLPHERHSNTVGNCGRGAILRIQATRSLEGCRAKKKKKGFCDISRMVWRALHSSEREVILKNKYKTLEM